MRLRSHHQRCWKTQRRSRWLAILLATTLLVSGPMLMSLSPLAGFLAIAPTINLGVSPAAAQLPTINVIDTAQILYDRLPFLPLENEYVDEDGQSVPESTLLTRMLQYHTGVKQRQPFFRLDWKLTLADYLGVNETIQADTYPNSRTFRENPMDGDVAAVRQLSREQRAQLVDTVVLLLNPLASQQPSIPSTQPSAPTNRPAPPARPGMGTSNPLPLEPQPGDAQLLLP